MNTNMTVGKDCNDLEDYKYIGGIVNNFDEVFMGMLMVVF